MFCPRCKTEYREGFYECADCGVPLVAVLPEEEENKGIAGELPDSADVAVVFQTANNFDFINAAKILEEAGIPFCGRNPYTAASAADKPAPGAYVWTLLAPEEYGLEAVRILNERMCGQIEVNEVHEVNDVDEIAEEAGRIIEAAEPPESSRHAEQSPIIMEGEGSSRKIILFIIIAVVLGVVIMFLRK